MSENPKSSCSKVNESGHQVSDEQVLQISGVEPLRASDGDAETVIATSAETKKEFVQRVAEEQEKFVPVSSDQGISKSMLLQESVTSQETGEPKQAAIVIENVENQKQDLIRAEKSQENLTFPADEIATAEKPEASAAIKNVVVVIEEAVAEGWEAFGYDRNIVVTVEGAAADEHEDSAVVKNVVESTENNVARLREASAAVKIVVDAIEDEKVEKQEAATNALSVVVDSFQDAVIEVPEASAAVQSIDAAEDIIAEEQEASTIVKSVAVDPVLDFVTRPETSAAIKSVDAVEDGMTEEQEVSATVKNVVVSLTEDAVTTEPETSVAVQSVDAVEDRIAEEQEASIVKSLAVDPVLDSVTRPGTSAAIKSVAAVEDGMTGEQKVSATVKNVVVSLTEDAVNIEPETLVAVQSIDATEDMLAEEHDFSAAVGNVAAHPIKDSVAERPKASVADKREDSDYVTAEEDSVDQDWFVVLLKDSAAERNKVYESVKNLDIDDSPFYADVKNVIDLLEQALFGEDEVSATNKKVVDTVAQVHEASESVINIYTVAEETKASSTTIKDETLEAAAKGNETFLVGGRLAHYDTEAIFRETDATKYSDRVLPASYMPPTFDTLFKNRIRDLNELSLAAENLRKYLDYNKRVPQLILADESRYASRVTLATERAFPPQPDMTLLGEELDKAWIEVQQSILVFLRETKDLLQRHREESPKLRLEDVDLYLEKFCDLRARVKNLQKHAEACGQKFRYNFLLVSVITNITKLTEALDNLLLTVYFDLSKICVFERRSIRCPTSDL